MSLTDRTDGSWPGAARSRVGSIVLPLVLAVVAVASSALVPATAQAATPYVVAEVASGRVLMSEDATMPWYPASVTKLMTAYVALQAAAGRRDWTRYRHSRLVASRLGAALEDRRKARAPRSRSKTR